MCGLGRILSRLSKDQDTLDNDSFDTVSIFINYFQLGHGHGKSLITRQVLLTLVN